MNSVTDKNLRAVVAQDSNLDSLVLLDCGDVIFLMPGNEIAAIMSVSALHASIAKNHLACGTIECDQQTIPVFCLNKTLQLQSLISTAHEAIVVIENGSHRFAFTCTTLDKIVTAKPAFYKVPTSMSSRKQPFTQFAIIESRAAGVTNAQKLARLLQQRGVSFTAPVSIPLIAGSHQ